MSRLTLMAVLAHPDDEAFGIGGTLAKYAADACDVHVVAATRGEAGRIRDPSLANKANLPQVREEELRCACAVYGVQPPHFLDYVDGQLPIVHQGQAVGKIVRLIREIRPQVLITFGPDGIYGHYDHIAVHRWTTIAYDLAADPNCVPDLVTTSCVTHQVQKLYYQVLPQEAVDILSPEGKPATVLMDGVPFPMIGWPRDKITTIIDIHAQLATKFKGLGCHATQVDVSDMPQQLDEMLHMLGQETFVLARTAVGWPEGVETDLFWGLR